MNCCEKCFEDKALVKHIQRKGKKSWCDFCKARNVRVVPAASLSEMFKQVVSLFEPVEKGKHFLDDPTAVGETLPECLELKKGWRVFKPKLSVDTKCALLDEIRCIDPRSGDNDSVRSRELWAAPEDSFFHSSEEDIWRSFAEGIKWKRRFIPDSKSGFMTDPKDWLPQYLHEIATFTKPGAAYYRARLGGMEEHYKVSKPYPAKDMGTPPKTRATAGRANPAGIPYLYVAEQAMTAVCEIRPFLGGRVTVAAVKPRSDLQLVDLTKVRFIESPFGLADLQVEMERNALLSILNRELSKPVNPALAEIEYVPTQYLAEVILNAGYDGIRYKSAMHSGGFNVVFFDQDKLEIDAKTTLVKVTANKLAYTSAADEDSV